MIGRDAVAEQRQRARAGDVGRAAPARGVSVVEERRVANVGRIGLPLRSDRPVGHARAICQRASPLNTSAYCSRNISACTAREHRLLDLALGRPDVAQDRPACRSRPTPSGSVVRSIVILAGERVGDDQRRRRQIVGAHLLLDASFEIAIAAQHRGDDQISCVDFRRHVVGQRPAVADARRAAVADQIEAELVEIRLEARLSQILGHDFRAGREAGLHPRLTCDSPRSTAFLASRPAAIITLGFDVFVQLVIAAITTEPCSSCCATAGSTATPPSRGHRSPRAALLDATVFLAPACSIEPSAA